MHIFDPQTSNEEKMSQDETVTVRTFLWVLFVFKSATVAATIWAAGWTSDAAYLLSITSWPWLIIPLLALSGPFLYQYRVRKARRRRAELLLSEWMIGEESPSSGALEVIPGNAGENQHGN